jgi:hypothetical protein
MFNNVTLIDYLGCDAESRITRNNSTCFRLRQSGSGKTVRRESVSRGPELAVWTSDRHMLASASHFGLMGRSV